MKATMPDVSHWLTKQQAAQALGVSIKTVENLHSSKQLQKAKRTRPGLPPIAVYHPDDVERLRKARQPPNGQPFVLPANASLPAARDTVVPNKLDFSVLFENLSRTSNVRIAERVYLTMAEASAYSGLPRTHLHNLIKEATLPALKTGAGWRIRRRDLESL